MEQPKKPSGFPAREILVPALKVGALSGKHMFCIYWDLRKWLYPPYFLHMKGTYQPADDYSFL